MNIKNLKFYSVHYTYPDSQNFGTYYNQFIVNPYKFSFENISKSTDEVNFTLYFKDLKDLKNFIIVKNEMTIANKVCFDINVDPDSTENNVTVTAPYTFDIHDITYKFCSDEDCSETSSVSSNFHNGIFQVDLKTAWTGSPFFLDKDLNEIGKYLM